MRKLEDSKTDENPGLIVGGALRVGLSVEKDQTLDIAGEDVKYSHMAKYLRLSGTSCLEQYILRFQFTIV